MTASISIDLHFADPECTVLSYWLDPNRYTLSILS